MSVRSIKWCKKNMREVHRIEYHSNVNKLLMFIIYSIKRFVPCCCLTPVDLTLSHSGLLHRHLVIPRKQPWKIWLNCHMDWHFRVNISRFSLSGWHHLSFKPILYHIFFWRYSKKESWIIDSILIQWSLQMTLAIHIHTPADSYAHKWACFIKTCQLDLNGRAD